MVFFGGGKQIYVTGKTVGHQMLNMNGHRVPLFHIVPIHSKLSSKVELLAKTLLAKFVIKLILITLKRKFLLVSLEVSLYRFLPVP